MTHVVVMGVSGVGKTTVGERLADALDLPYLEGDALHSAASVAKMARGEPLTDADREPWLDVVGRRLAALPGAVATCSALKRAYRDRLRSHVADLVFVHLTADAGILRARVRDRPEHFMPARLLDSQLATLEPLERGEAGITLDTAPPVADVVRRASLAVRAEPAG